MTEYQVEFDAVTEHSDARTGEPLSIDVETYVRRAESDPVPADSPVGEFVVRFDVEEGAIRFRECETVGDAPTTRRTVAAIRLAAEKLRELKPDYDVPDPLDEIGAADREVFDSLP